MKEKIIRILTDIKDDVDFESSAALIDDGLLVSLDIIQLISELDDEFDISIPASEIVPDNFNSVERMAAMVERLMEEE